MQSGAAAGKKPWTARYFSGSALVFLGLANGEAERHLRPALITYSTPDPATTL